MNTMYENCIPPLMKYTVLKGYPRGPCHSLGPFQILPVRYMDSSRTFTLGTTPLKTHWLEPCGYAVPMQWTIKHTSFRIIRKIDEAILPISSLHMRHFRTTVRGTLRQGIKTIPGYKRAMMASTNFTAFSTDGKGLYTVRSSFRPRRLIDFWTLPFRSDNSAPTVPWTLKTLCESRWSYELYLEAVPCLHCSHSDCT